MFNSNSGSIKHLFEIFDFEKHSDLEVPARGHLRSLKLVPFNTTNSLPMVSCLRFIVTLSLKCTTFEIFAFEKYHYLN